MNKEIETKLSIIKLGKIPRNYKRHNRDLLPLDWKSVKIEEVMNIKNNYRVPISESKRKTIQGIYPYYGPTKIQDYIDRYTLEGEHVLIGEDGDHFLKYKEKKMTLLVSGKFNVNNHAHIIQGTKLCDTKWFYYVFQHKNILDSVTRQGVGRYKLTKEALRNIEFSLPKLSEQQNIIRILEVWDKSIDLKEKLLQEKQKQKQGLMQRLLTGEKRIKGFEEKWEITKLGCVFKERKEVGFENLELLAVTSADGIVRRCEVDIKDNSSEDKSKYKRILPGDIGYNTMRMWQGVSGLSKYDGIVSPAYTILKPAEKIDSKFMAYLFKLPKIINLFYRYSQGLVNDTLNLKYENFKKIKVVIPKSLEEQKQITRILDKSSEEIKLLEKEIELLKEQKNGLMQLLLTGIVRVKCD